MLPPQHFHLMCWQVAILSSQPGNEPMSHIWRKEMLTSWFHKLFGMFTSWLRIFWTSADFGTSEGFLSGRYTVTFCWRQMRPRVVWSRWLMHYVCPEVPEGNTRRSDLWFEAAGVERWSQSVRNPLTENWPGLTGRAYWAPVATLMGCSLLTSALNPAALWTKCSLIVTKSKVIGLIREVSCKSYATFLRGHDISVKESKWGYFYRYFLLLLWNNPSISLGLKAYSSHTLCLTMCNTSSLWFTLVNKPTFCRFILSIYSVIYCPKEVWDSKQISSETEMQSLLFNCLTVSSQKCLTVTCSDSQLSVTLGETLMLSDM